MTTTPFIEKLLKVQFGAISTNWFYELYSWCINSKTRQFKRVDLFLKDQLDNVKDTDNLYLLAQSLRGKTPDETAFNIEEWVWKNTSYDLDIKNFGAEEYWATANEVFIRRKDDCDGLNSLIFILCKLAGIGSSCLYSVLGSAKGGYHYYCLYYSTKLNKLVKLDATYLPQVISIKDKDEFKLDSDYLKIDYIFNDEGSWRCG